MKKEKEETIAFIAMMIMVVAMIAAFIVDMTTKNEPVVTVLMAIAGGMFLIFSGIIALD